MTNRAVYQGHTYPVWCLDIDRLGTNAVTGQYQFVYKFYHTSRSINSYII
jgi:hypothetical protein